MHAATNDLFSSTSITIMTKRNQPLTATVYTPLIAKEATVKQAVMIAPATGIKRHFYHNFAKAVAEKGIGVITYDNEGIGDSLTCEISKCDASIISWGRYDMPAVLDALQDEFAQASYHLVGHSAGGQLIGLMKNHSELSSVFNVACSSGQIRNMDMPFKAQALFFMNIVIPLGNLLLGYTPADKVGMGDPLPRGVAKQWREWCLGAGYIKTAFGKTVHNHYYNEITTPAKWLNFTDDDIANAKNLEDMLRVFPKMPVTKVMIDPKDFDLSIIGHMKYFSSKTQAKAPQLWEMATDWINEYGE